MQGSDRIKLGNEQLIEAWQTGRVAQLVSTLTDDARFYSVQHGTQKGAQQVADALLKDTLEVEMTGQITNHFASTQGDQGASSFYWSGFIQHPSKGILLIGCTLVTRWCLSDEVWRCEEIRLAMNWSHGGRAIMPHWSALPGQSGWRFGDAPPVLVSELHSPWRLLPNMARATSLENAMADLYAKYAFAVDQNDFALLSSVYSQDISGGFAPMGELQGRDQVVGMLKSFRHLAPFWQHFAQVVRLEVEEDGQHARMIVARIMPERPWDEQGNKIFGAHYQLRTRLQEDGQWRICWTDYRPGWFSIRNLPEFDIGHVAKQ